MENSERTEHTSLTDRTQQDRPQRQGGSADAQARVSNGAGQRGERSEGNRPASRRRNRNRRRARRRSSTAGANNADSANNANNAAGSANKAGAPNTAGSATSSKKEPNQEPNHTPKQHPETEHTRAADAHTQFSPVDEAPFAIVTVQTNGIHPKTGRLVSLGICTADTQGNIVDTWHVVIDPNDNPGPTHLHGLGPEDFEGAPRFSVIQSKLAHALDGRILITHNAPRVWGFIVAEAKRARRQANRENLHRRNRGRRYRPRVGKIPAPTTIIDTLATARRQSTPLTDTRLRGVARAYGLDVPSPVASEAGRLVPERVRTLDDVATSWELFIAEGGLEAANLEQADQEREVLESTVQWPESIAAIDAKDMKEDKVGLQRSAIRVEAMEAPRPVDNPGKYVPGGRVEPGMEFAIAPQVTADPDVLIEAGMTAGLVYSEKVTRETSLLVCNRPADVTPDELTGKAMHAHRKEIPMVSDTAFLRLVRSMD